MIHNAFIKTIFFRAPRHACARGGATLRSSLFARPCGLAFGHCSASLVRAHLYQVNTVEIEAISIFRYQLFTYFRFAAIHVTRHDLVGVLRVHLGAFFNELVAE